MSEAALDEMIAAARARYGLSAPEVAKAAAPAVQAAIRATAAAGTTPDGKPWPPRKAGGRALAHAADHIETRAMGTVVRTTLSGPDVWHHFGTGRAPRRQVLPDGGSAVPRSVTDAIAGAASARFAAATGGG